MRPHPRPDEHTAGTPIRRRGETIAAGYGVSWLRALRRPKPLADQLAIFNRPRAAADELPQELDELVDQYDALLARLAQARVTLAERVTGFNRHGRLLREQSRCVAANVNRQGDSFYLLPAEGGSLVCLIGDAVSLPLGLTHGIDWTVRWTEEEQAEGEITVDLDIHGLVSDDVAGLTLRLRGHEEPIQLGENGFYWQAPPGAPPPAPDTLVVIYRNGKTRTIKLPEANCCTALCP